MSRELVDQKEATMSEASCASRTEGGPKARAKHLSYDESVDEAGKAIESEPVEIEAEVPADENEPVEGTAEDAEPAPPRFEE
jgi:hypothetical protein